MSAQTLETRLRNIYLVLLEGTKASDSNWDQLAAASSISEAATRIHELETTLRAIEALTRAAAEAANEGAGT